MALNRLWMPSPNYSSRGGTRVRLVIVHTAEGSTSIESLAAFFANPDAGVSSHTGADNHKPNTVGEMVRPDMKAWAAANANPYAVQIELCGFASWDAATWARNQTMLANCAAWIAEECARFNIPIRKLSEPEAANGAAGVVGHADLGYAGNDHWDPGPSFPWVDVLAMASGGAPPTTTQPTRKRGRNMIAETKSGNGYWTTTADGAVYAFGDARYCGGANDPDAVTGEVVGIAGKDNDGYWLLASDGGVFAFGSAGFYGRPDRV